MKLLLATVLSVFVLAACGSALAKPDLPEGPLVQACTGEVGVFAEPCANWFCVNVGGSWGTPGCIPLVPDA